MLKGLILLIVLISLITTSFANATEAWKVDRNPSLSSNGGVIAFERDSLIMVLFEKSKLIYSLTSQPYVTPNARKPIILGKPLWDDYMHEPAISPGLNMVAWRHDDIGAMYDFSNVYITNLKTGKITKLTTKGGSYPIWSPDGKWVAYIKSHELRAINIHTKKTKLLVSNLGDFDKLEWFGSGIATARLINGNVAWYHINKDGTLKRITPLLRLPLLSKNDKIFRVWDLSCDGKKAIYIDFVTSKVYNWFTFKKCTIHILTRYSNKIFVVSNLKWLEKKGWSPDPNDVSVTISGNGNKFVMALIGGLWKGDLKTGKIKLLTHTLYYMDADEYKNINSELLF